jgi:hypothetical protein
MKLYTVVVHNLQMCMKEYRCCLKFRRGDNSTYTFTKRGVVYLWRPLDAHLQVVYYKCVKFHKNQISSLGGVALTRYMDGRTGWFLYIPQTLFVGGMGIKTIDIKLIRLYTVKTVQTNIKEYGCCPKFKRRDNSTYTFTKRGACTL